MSSVSRLLIRPIAIATSAAALAVPSGCTSSGGDAASGTVPRGAAAAASTAATSPVGPLPGTDARIPPPAVNPYTDDLQALQHGRRYFVAYNCAGCHGDHGGGGMGPSLRDEAWIYGSSDEDIANSIAEGRALGMPAWSRMLTEAQIWQITAYIKTMRTEKEPDPPTGM